MSELVNKALGYVKDIEKVQFKSKVMGLSQDERHDQLKDDFNSGKSAKVRRAFKWANKTYQAGDNFKPKKDMRSRALEVLTPEHIMTAGEFKESAVFKADKDRREAVINLNGELNQASNQLDRAKEKEASLKAQLAGARQEIKHAQGAIDKKAQAIIDLFEGKELG
jgi:hypothetical protein